MSSERTTPGGSEPEDADSDGPVGLRDEELTARLEVLQEENRRLRAEYVRARRVEYRRTALGVGVLGLAAGLGALVFPGARAVLLSLAGIGLFTAVLTYYLTPERFVAASVGEQTDAARAALGSQLVSDLGLQDVRVYVPTGTETGETLPARLFVPQHSRYELPESDELASVFIVPEDERARGASVPPTGAMLFEEFERTMTGAVAETPAELADQLLEALVEGFELADDAVLAEDVTPGRVTVGVRGSAFGPVDRFDHPIPSLVATGLAVGLDRPVTVETVRADDDRYDYLLSFSWDDDDGSVDEDESAEGSSEEVTDGS